MGRLRHIKYENLIGGSVIAQPPAFSPANISPYAWWDWSDNSNTTIEGGEYSGVQDKSGNSRNLSQSTSASRPTVQTLNGLNCGYFDGVDDFMSMTSSLGITDEFHIFAVVTNEETGTTNRSFFKDSTNGTIKVGSFNRTKLLGRFAPGGDADTGIDWGNHQGTVHVAEFKRDASNNESYAFQFQADTPMGVETGTFDADIIGDGGGATEDWVGKIAEIIILDRNATTEERDNLETYLIEKWFGTYAVNGGGVPALNGNNEFTT